MKSQWMTAAVLGSVLVVGCSADENASNPNENQPPEAAAPATDQAVAPAPEPAPSPERDNPPARTDTAVSRQTSGNRTASTSRPAAPSSSPQPLGATEPRREAPPRPVVRYATIPAGTSLPLELTSAVTTETATVEMPVTARLRRDVDVSGVTAIPAGSVFHGEVIEAERPGRVQGRARLALRFTSVTIGEEREDLRTNPIVFEGEQTKGEDATKIGAGAGIGAVIGGILGGGDGAAKGAAIGGAAGTGAVLATRGREITLAAGADLTATTASEADVRVR